MLHEDFNRKGFVCILSWSTTSLKLLPHVSSKQIVIGPNCKSMHLVGSRIISAPRMDQGLGRGRLSRQLAGTARSELGGYRAFLKDKPPT